MIDLIKKGERICRFTGFRITDFNDKNQLTLIRRSSRIFILSGIRIERMTITAYRVGNLFTLGCQTNWSALLCEHRIDWIGSVHDSKITRICRLLSIIILISSVRVQVILINKGRVA